MTISESITTLRRLIVKDPTSSRYYLELWAHVDVRDGQRMDEQLPNETDQAVYDRAYEEAVMKQRLNKEPVAIEEEIIP